MRKFHFDYTKECELVDANSVGISIITTGNNKKLNINCKALNDTIQGYLDSTGKLPEVVLIGKAVFEAIDQEISSRFGDGTAFRGSTLVCNMYSRKEIPILGTKDIPENAVFLVGDLIQEGLIPEHVVHEEEDIDE